MTAHDKNRKVLFEKGLMDAMGPLKRFAFKRTGDHALAEDLVQATMERALLNQDKFQDGTNLRAWLFTMLKNIHLNHIRKYRREGDEITEAMERNMSAPASQEDHMALIDFAKAFSTLPKQQQDAMMASVIADNNYDTAAEVCGCKTGTIKSRVSRSRQALTAILEGDVATNPVASDTDDILSSVKAHAFGPGTGSSGVRPPQSVTRPSGDLPLAA